MNERPSYDPKMTAETPSHPLLEQDRDVHAEAGMSPEQASSLFAELRRQTLDARPGPLARLRELPTGLRAAMAVFATALVVAVLLVATGPRSDLDRGGWMHLGVILVAFAGLVAAGIALALRGLHRAPPRGGAWFAVAAALLGPVLLALVPSLLPEGGSMGAAAAGAGSCALVGVLTGSMTAAGVWCLQRQSRPAAWRLVSAAGAGGAAAFLLLEAHCPAGSVGHRMFGHASIGLALAAALVLYALVRGPVGDQPSPS